MRIRHLTAILGCLICAAGLGACDSSATDSATDSATPCPAIYGQSVSVDGTQRAAGSQLMVHITLSPACSTGNTTRAYTATGGGVLDPATVTLDSAGKATMKWTLGPAPVQQRIVELDYAVTATLPKPVSPTPFADIDKWMTANKLDGSTEDLAIRADGSMAIGIPGGILDVAPDGTVTRPTLTGDAVNRALGMAYDANGTLWVADPDGKALRAIDKNHVVTTPLTGDGTGDFVSPNDVAVDRRNGHVIVSDPCLGRLVAFDPAAGKVLDTHAFAGKTEGGPNGFAFDGTGNYLYVLTENTALVCPSGDKPKITDPVGGLFRIDTSGTGFGGREPIATNIGHFGDGMAFDKLGNLYVVVTSAKGVQFEKSAVMVLRKGEKTLVPFVETTDSIIANVAFGRGALGTTTVYAALLAVPPFTSEDKRGLVKFEVGIAGQSLL